MVAKATLTCDATHHTGTGDDHHPLVSHAMRETSTGAKALLALRTMCVIGTVANAFDQTIVESAPVAH